MANSPAPSFDSICAQIRANKVAPVYFLHGEEGYYIDEIVKLFPSIIPPEDRDFNSYTIHAPDTTPAAVIDLCHRIPMLAERQLVILKEAQLMRVDDLNKFKPYFENPVDSTILVIVHRAAKCNSKPFLAACAKSGVVTFESCKLDENEAPNTVAALLKEHGLSSEPKAVQMMCDFIGIDIARLRGEVEKLATLLPPKACVTPEVVEKNIGISRNYNTTELLDAISSGDAPKAFRIIAYFRANPKSDPLPVVVGTIFSFFSNLLIAHYMPDKSDYILRNELKVYYDNLKRLKNGLRQYSAVRVVEILSAIRAFDAQSKGVGSRQDAHQLFYDLIYHIFTAPGRL